MTLNLSKLSTLQDEQRKPRATPKHKVTASIIAKDEKKKTREKKGGDFRESVWARDKSICRATGVPLLRAGMDDDRVGEVDHSYPRSTSPELIYVVKHGILISRRLNRLRKAACVQQPQFRVFDYTGPSDRKKKQTFTLRDYKTGRVIWQRTSAAGDVPIDVK